MKKLADKYPQSVAPLTFQYRMHAEICRLSSEAFYGGRLKCADEEVRSRTLEVSNFPSCLPLTSSLGMQPWLRDVINPTKCVVFVDTDSIKRNPAVKNGAIGESNQSDPGIEALEENAGGRVSGNIINQTEAILVRFILKGLLSTGLPASSICVICPFQAQVCLLIYSFMCA